jgi:hypothetical protein
MTKEVAGVPLKAFEVPIYDALERYSEISEGEVIFENPSAATKLELTPDKPNSARSTVTVRHLG